MKHVMAADETCVSTRKKNVQRRPSFLRQERSAAVRLHVFTIYFFLLLLALLTLAPVLSFRSLSLQHNNEHCSSRTSSTWSTRISSNNIQEVRRCSLAPWESFPRRMIHSSSNISIRYAATRNEGDDRNMAVTAARGSSNRFTTLTSTASDNVWEQMAMQMVDVKNDPSLYKDYVQMISALRIGLPAFAIAAVSNLVYPYIAMTLANIINDGGVFAVVSQDASQYIQNILTTSGLVFSLLVGQTFCTCNRCYIRYCSQLS
jgi:hypothetical protein